MKFFGKHTLKEQVSNAEKKLGEVFASSVDDNDTKKFTLNDDENLPIDTFRENLHPIVKYGLNDSATVLSHFADEITTFEQENFADHALLLMRACVAERKYSSLYDYEAIQAECKKLFGDESLHARFQAKIHAALLLDFSKEEERLEIIQNFKLFLTTNKSSLKIPFTLFEALYHSLCILSMAKEREQYQINSRFLEEFEILYLEYSVRQKKEELYYKKESELNEFTKGESAKKTRNPMSRAFYAQTVPYAAHSILDSTRKGKNFSLSLINSVKDYLLPETTANSDSVDEHFPTTPLSIDEEVRDMENFSLALRDTELLEKILTFRSLFVPQDFRIVTLGEGKRGKTTLINALLGKEILPTRAILPETNTLIELAYSKEPYFEIEWLDEYEFEKLELTLKDDEENLLLKEKVKSFKHILENKEILENLKSTHINHIDELHEYSSPDGLYSSLVKKIRIGLKEDSLPKGILLVDTPATNASDPFLHYLTKEECLRADCLIILLDSRQPDSYSELQLLKSIIKEGRAVKIIGILTHPLPSDFENEIAKKRATTIIQEAIREVSGIKLLDVFSFSPKNVLEYYEKNQNVLNHLRPQKKNSEYLKFLDILTNTVKNHAENDLSSERMKNTYTHLCTTVNARKHKLLNQYSKFSPSAQHISLLESHTSNLTKASEEYAEHARALILNALNEIEEWHRQSINAIDALEERILLNLSNEMRLHAEKLGKNFAKESEWKEFDELIATLIAQELIEDFKKEQSTHLTVWEEKILTFNRAAEKISLECLSKIQDSSNELNVLCASDSTFDNLLVQTNSYMQKITLLLSGAGVGMLANAGIVNILALGTAGLAFLTNPIVIPSALFLGISAFALNKISNPAKVKEAFLHRKELKIQSFTKKLKEELYTQADEIQEELLFAYSSSIHKSLAPALEIMAYEAVNLRLYLESMKKFNNTIQIELCTTQETPEITEEI